MFASQERRSLRRFPAEDRARVSSTSQVVDLVVVLLLFPECKVLLEELNDALGVTEVVFLELINLVQSRLQGGVREGASRSVVLQHFVVKDAEVEGEAELDGVASGEIDGVGLLVSGLSLVLDILEDVILGVLSDVAVVIADHLHEEGPSLVGARTREHAVVDHVDDLLAVSLKLRLDLLLVRKQSAIKLGVFRVRLDGGDGAACSALARDEVLEGNRKKVALVRVDSTALGDKDLLKEVDHIIKALSLLSDTS